MRNLTFKQLNAVQAIALRGSITAAAATLHLTPAALTARLKQIEGVLGLALFDRTAAGLRATQAGELVLAAAERVGATLGECAENVDALRGLRGGRVSIGVVSTAKYFAPRALAAFRHRHPDVEVRLSVGNREEVIRLLRDYAIDLAIMGRPSRDFAATQAAFGEHPLVLIAAPDHRLAKRRRLRLGEIAKEVFLTRERGSGTRTVFESLCAKMGDQPPTIGMEITSNETIKQAVMAGLGIALISAHTVEAELAEGRLAILPVAGLPIRRKWFLVRRSDRHPAPAASRFWEFMLAEGTALLPRLRMR